MLTNLEVYSSQASPPDVPLLLGGTPGDDSIFIKDIQGLGPVKASISTRPSGSSGGAFFTGSTIGQRNIVIEVGFNPDWVATTPSSLRQKLYAYFMPQQPVTLRFFRDDGPAVEIKGYAEGCEPVIFSKEPAMQISVICPSPDFVGVSPSEVVGETGLNPDPVAFSLVSNLSVPALVELTADPGDAAYEGVVSLRHGTVLGAPISKFEVVGAIEDGTDLVIESTRGAKRVENVYSQTSETVNRLPSMTTDSVWLELRPGINTFRVVTASADPKNWALRYYERFGGL